MHRLFGFLMINKSEVEQKNTDNYHYQTNSDCTHKIKVINISKLKQICDSFKKDV